VRAAVLGDCVSGSVAAGLDNADTQPPSPDGFRAVAGMLLITSRARNWAEIRRAWVEVNVLALPESTAILAAPGVWALATADAISSLPSSGTLPLAIAPAADSMAEPSTPASQYLQLLQHGPGICWTGCAHGSS